MIEITVKMSEPSYSTVRIANPTIDGETYTYSIPAARVGVVTRARLEQSFELAGLKTDQARAVLDLALALARANTSKRDTLPTPSQEVTNT